jgi:hypothetical protein
MEENAGVGEVKSFPEYDTAILPLSHVAASGVADLTLLPFTVQYFKEEVKLPVVLYHERIGNKSCPYVIYLLCREYGICDLDSRGEKKRRRATINTNRPNFAVSLQPFYSVSFQAIQNEWGRRGEKQESQE